MNFCDDFHIYENFADLNKSTEFPMVDRLKKQTDPRIVILNTIMLNICVQKYEMTFVPGNITEAERNNFLFMQG